MLILITFICKWEILMHFEIDGIDIGKNTPAFIIAELSCNHRGDLDIAKKALKKLKKLAQMQLNYRLQRRMI